MTLSLARKNQKLIFFVASIFLLAAFFLILFHHHAEGHHQLDCAVCRLVQQMACLFVLALAASIGGLSKSQSLATVFSQNFNSLLLPSRLQTRAPPLLS